MRRVIVIAALLVLAQVPGSAAAAPPNVIVVMTDDQRAEGTMDAMPKTRRLIGRRGTTYTRAYATTPKCCPSRATFFTGQYAHNHKVVNNNVPARLDHSRTVQRLLQQRGYRTAIFGKFMNGWPLTVDPPFFDEWAIMSSGFQQASWNSDGRVRKIRRYTTDLISDRAIGFIRRAERERDKTPWFTWLMPYAPHLPSTPARRHRDAPLRPFHETPAILEEHFSDKPDFLDRARGYGSLIATARDDGRRSLMAVDEMVARLVRELRRRKELRRTLFIFTSDNGMLLGDHGGLVGKDLPYEGSTRIPLLVRWPGRVMEGAIRSDFVTNADIATTVLRAARVRRGTDGTSLVSGKRRRTLFQEAFGARNNRGTLVLPPWRTLRTEDYRYTEYRRMSGGSLAREFYDLRVDPWELENRAGSLSARRVERLDARLRRLARCKGTTCP